MTVVALVLLALLVAYLRRRRKTTLAGLDSDRPTFSIAPPTRYVTRLKDHRL